MSSRVCLFLASVFGFLAVLFGAFGAHGLSDSGYLEQQYANDPPGVVAGLTVPAAFRAWMNFRTAVRYHMWHALALLAAGVWKQRCDSTALSVAAWCFTLGIVLFSGALYVLVIGGSRFAGVPWGAVVPLGGTAFLAGWSALTVAAIRRTGGIDRA